MNILTSVLACVLGTSSLMFAQDPINLTIQTNIDSAVVIIDSARAGVTPLTITSLSPGLHRLTLVHPDPSNQAHWATGNVVDSIMVQPGDSRTLRYTFDTPLMVASQPFGAEVLVGDSLIGTTPLVLRTTSILDRGTLRIRKPGYEETLINDPLQGFAPVHLKKKWDYDGEDPALLSETTKKNTSLRPIITGVATIVSGVTAAYCKIKADNRYNAYQQTGTPSLLAETHRLDTISAVALIATQVGLGLFTYFMLSE